MKKIIIAALLTAVVAAPAVAADMYVGVKLGNVNYGYTNVTNNSQAGYGLLGGYTINENFSMEAEYNSLGGFTGGTDTVKGSSIGVSGIGSYPFNPQFSLFGKLGIASTSLKITTPGFSALTVTNTGLAIGLGGQYNVSPEVGIRVGYDINKVGKEPTTTTSAAGMLYLGGVYKF